MRRSLLGVALSALAALMFGALAANAQDKLASQKTVYEKNCQKCHAPDGSGMKDGKVLSVFKTMKLEKESQLSLLTPEAKKLTDADIEKAVLTGKGKMKGLKEKLTADEAKGQVEYTRQLQAQAK